MVHSRWITSNFNLFIADVASVWENVSNFIEKHMSQQKVNIIISEQQTTS